MSLCMNATLTRVGNMSATTTRVGGIDCSATRVGDMSVAMTRVGGMDARMTRVGGISCAMYQVCMTNIRRPYLEISPQIVWVLAGHTENDVYSNTRWNID